MLKQRIITAVLLMLVLLPALFATSAWPFTGLMLVAVSLAGWEWGRLNGLQSAGAVAMGGMVALGALAMLDSGWLQATPPATWQVATLLWVLGGAYALRAGVSGWPQHSLGLRLLTGALLLWLAWLAVAVARSRGIDLLLSTFCLVWMADIAAYFGGKRFGRRKLAPGISPGKSWEGAFSGVLGVLVLALCWVGVERALGAQNPSLYALLLDRWGVVGAALGLVFLAALSIVGDLFESLVKRAAGAKDSSGLLPGHGGVLDRIDALLPVCPLALGLIT